MQAVDCTKCFLETKLVKRPDELSCCVVNLLKCGFDKHAIHFISLSIHKYFKEITKIQCIADV